MQVAFPECHPKLSPPSAYYTEQCRHRFRPSEGPALPFVGLKSKFSCRNLEFGSLRQCRGHTKGSSGVYGTVDTTRGVSRMFRLSHAFDVHYSLMDQELSGVLGAA